MIYRAALAGADPSKFLGSPGVGKQIRVGFDRDRVDLSQELETVQAR